ncbi:DUF3139 domain-containing protein [Cytobacillus sp. FJAT-54145]|uniref:DUF3139 domain-containing protein n=1 Tax=Cytobacillus spartinae TaxID=3299023 RepID=A0ABW6KEY3_9BACI
MKKLSWALTVSLLFVVIVLGCAVIDSFVGNPISKKLSENQVIDYLVNEKSYSKEDFYVKSTSYSMATGYYYTKIVFKDEPQFQYTYVKKQGTVAQTIFDYYPSKEYKHIEPEIHKLLN